MKDPAEHPAASRLPWPVHIALVLRRDLPLALLDVGLVMGCYLASLVLRFDGAVPQRYWMNFWRFMPVAVLLYLVFNSAFGLYGQMWRFASVQEARRVILAGGTAGLLVAAVGSTFTGSLRLLPLSAMLLGGVLSLLALGAVRFHSRLFAFKRHSGLTDPTRVLLVGAGEAGEAVLRDMLGSRSFGLEPVGIVDDDRRKVGRSLHGVPILGTRGSIPPLVERLQAEQVLLAIPSATSELVRDVAALCEEADVPLRVLPSVRELVGGRITARDIRDLRIEDLLGRQQVETNLEAVAGILTGRRVLVTGAGGSIGSEIIRQVLSLSPSSLVLLDHDETHLHEVEEHLRGNTCVESVLADVRDQQRMLAVFGRFRPDVVFHAAAHKHVPILETHPEEAVQTNVMGAANVAEAAVATGVSRLVFISTDKAINPASIMGISKWFGEQIVLSLQGAGCVLCVVRFGNVLGSRGSVIPTFLRQIAAGGPVTVTDPSMTRYFMSSQEAVQLVLQAAALAQGGEVFTLDMGEQVNILALARKLIRLSGRVPDRDVEIAVVGRRPGEKLEEELVGQEEDSVSSSHPGILVSRPPPPHRPALRRAIWELDALAREGRSEELAERMRLMASEGLRPSVRQGVG